MLKKLLSQTAIYGLSSILGRALNLLLTPLYTKLLSTATFGQISDVFSWTAMLNVLLTFGMETTFFRYMREQEGIEGQEKYKVYRHAFLVVSLLTSFLFLAGMLFAQPLSDLLHYGDIPFVIQLIVGILLLDNLAALPMARLRYEEKAKHFAAINLLNIFLTLSLNYYFLKICGFGAEYIFFSNLIASAVRLLMALVAVKGETIPLRGLDIQLLREMLAYGGFIMLAGLAGMQNENLDKILLKRLWVDGTPYHGLARSGTEMLGIYSAGYKLGIFIALVIQAFRYAAEPFFFKKGADKDAPPTFARIFHYFILACLSCFLLVSAFMYEFVRIKIFGYSFIDAKFWEGLEIVPIILLAYTFAAAFNQLSIWFKLTKQTQFALYFTGVGAVITVLLNVLTIPRWGYIGSAWATLICYAVMSALAYFYGQKYFPIPYRLRAIGLYLLWFVAGYAACAYLGHETPLQALMKAAVCLIVFAGVYVREFRVPKRLGNGG